jgi:putative DNA primase/helicase
MARPSQAERIARALNGRRSGSGWMAYCPCHNNVNTPSLSVRDGDSGPLLKCFGASCDPGNILSVLRRRGLLDDDRPDKDRPTPASRAKANDNGRLAFDIWNQSVSLAGTLGEVYLTKRGLWLPPGAEMRFHPRCPRERDKQPAVIWLLRDIFTNRPRAIQRRFLLPDGTKDGPPKSLGPSAGTVWKLSDDEDVTYGLGLCEGHADALKVLHMGWSPVWVTSGTGTMMRFPVLDGIRSLTIFKDADNPGNMAAEVCAARWREAKREVRIVPPLGAKDFGEMAVAS